MEKMEKRLNEENLNSLKRECTETDPIEATAEALGTRWRLQVGKK